MTVIFLCGIKESQKAQTIAQGESRLARGQAEPSGSGLNDSRRTNSDKRKGDHYYG